ncbi:hypothetical protein C2845_PM07G37920 [Panicum miliaceum]|uniref:Uncharacterized protein n=1 Tax=Panicum miliaceum TaxID=4540 RepID=A0A3L6SQ89_PANMI|nr:hypothetical protein C2845_PM07G37920 [Panicum miliaceum]
MRGTCPIEKQTLSTPLASNIPITSIRYTFPSQKLDVRTNEQYHRTPETDQTILF